MEKEHGIEICGFCVNKKYLESNSFFGKPLYAFEELNLFFSRQSFEIIIAVGYKGMNRTREMIFHDCDEYGYDIGSYIQPGIRFEPETIGRGNIIADESRIFPFARIGDGNIIVNSVVSHDCNVGNFNFISSANIGGCSQIGNNCFVGIGANIGDHVHVGDVSLIGSGSFVSSDIDSCSIVSPSTPRVVRAREDIIGRMFR